jgi:hypothetical protein
MRLRLSGGDDTADLYVMRDQSASVAEFFQRFNQPVRDAGRWVIGRRD